jgi:hypothetical protein
MAFINNTHSLQVSHHHVMVSLSNHMGMPGFDSVISSPAVFLFGMVTVPDTHLLQPYLQKILQLVPLKTYAMLLVTLQL